MDQFGKAVIAVVLAAVVAIIVIKAGQAIREAASLAVPASQDACLKEGASAPE